MANRILVLNAPTNSWPISTTMGRHRIQRRIYSSGKFESRERCERTSVWEFWLVHCLSPLHSFSFQIESSIAHRKKSKQRKVKFLFWASVIAFGVNRCRQRERETTCLVFLLVNVCRQTSIRRNSLSISTFFKQTLSQFWFGFRAADTFDAIYILTLEKYKRQKTANGRIEIPYFCVI